MAVMHRNPMPLSGALFVTNPRRRRNSLSMRRKNALKLNRSSRRRNALKLNRLRKNGLHLGGLHLNPRRRRRRNQSIDAMGMKELRAEYKKLTGKTYGIGAGKSKADLLKKVKAAATPKKASSKKSSKKSGKKATGFAAMNLTQLKAKAKEKGLEGYSGLKKADLVKLLKSGKKSTGKSKGKTLKELRAEAKKKGLIGYSGLKKAELEKRLKSGAKGKRKKSGWAAFQQEYKSLGFTQAEMKRLWARKKAGKPDADFEKIKKAIRSKAKSLVRIGRTTRRKAYNEAKKAQPALFQNPFKLVNPRRRKNVGIAGIQPLAMPLAVVQDVQNAASKVPVVKFASFAVTPLALGATVYGVHRLAEPHILKFLDKTIADVPVLKETLKFPYTTTGVVAGIALGLLAKANILNAQAASLVAASAASVGIALDLSLRPVAKAAAEVVSEQVAEKSAQVAVEAAELVESGAAPMVAAAAATADDGTVKMVNSNGADMAGVHMSGVHMGRAYGDGGAYMIGRNSTSLSGMHFGSAADAEYADASPADAKAATPVMHPEEVAAAKAGASVWKRKFGSAPTNLRRGQSLMSRHAGRMGHRYGWLIKQIGFANFQKIAALPPQQRATVISQMQKQAIASIPKLIAAQQAQYSSVETASVPLSGTLNGVQGFQGAHGSYGAMMFAGKGY